MSANKNHDDKMEAIRQLYADRNRIINKKTCNDEHAIYIASFHREEISDAEYELIPHKEKTFDEQE